MVITSAFLTITECPNKLVGGFLYKFITLLCFAIVFSPSSFMLVLHNYVVNKTTRLPHRSHPDEQLGLQQALVFSAPGSQLHDSRDTTIDVSAFVQRGAKIKPTETV